jgi:hypothetical protein
MFRIANDPGAPNFLPDATCLVSALWWGHRPHGMGNEFASFLFAAPVPGHVCILANEFPGYRPTMAIPGLHQRLARNTVQKLFKLF